MKHRQGVDQIQINMKMGMCPILFPFVGLDSLDYSGNARSRMSWQTHLLQGNVFRDIQAIYRCHYTYEREAVRDKLEITSKNRKVFLLSYLTAQLQQLDSFTPRDRIYSPSVSRTDTSGRGMQRETCFLFSSQFGPPCSLLDLLCFDGRRLNVFRKMFIGGLNWETTDGIYTCGLD